MIPERCPFCDCVQGGRHADGCPVTAPKPDKAAMRLLGDEEMYQALAQALLPYLTEEIKRAQRISPSRRELVQQQYTSESEVS